MDAKPCSRTHCSRTSGGFNPRLPWDHMCDVRMTSHGFPGGGERATCCRCPVGVKDSIGRGGEHTPPSGIHPRPRGNHFRAPEKPGAIPRTVIGIIPPKISTLIFYGKSRLATTSHHQDNSRKNLSNYKDNLPACCNKKSLN